MSPHTPYEQPTAATQSQLETQLELRLRIAAVSLVEIDAVPHELADERFVQQWELYIASRKRVFNQIIHPLCCQLTLELLAGFPWPIDYFEYSVVRPWPTIANPEAHAQNIRDLRSMHGAAWRVHDKRNNHAPGYYDPAECVYQSRSFSYHGIFPLHEHNELRMYRKHGYIMRSGRDGRNSEFGSIRERARLIGDGCVIDTVVGYVPLVARNTPGAAAEHQPEAKQDPDAHSRATDAGLHA